MYELAQKRNANTRVSSRDKFDLSAIARERLVDRFKDSNWAIIDEISMISLEMLALISQRADVARAGRYTSDGGTSFGNLNVILAGDFYQFLPLALIGKALYRTSAITTEAQKMGRAIFEQFDKAVILRQQVRVTDPAWLEVLRAARHGACNNQTHIPMIRSLLLDNPTMPRPDFSVPPWSMSVLICSRHSVRKQWNRRRIEDHCRRTHNKLFICHASDTIRKKGMEPRPLSDREQEKSQAKDSSTKQLPDEVEMAIGMPCMVTVNVKTESDLANGTRGTLVDIVLDGREPMIDDAKSTVYLTYPPRYILFKPDETHAKSLEGLPEAVFPIEPMEKQFWISNIEGKKYDNH